jgi:hypothetical protein
MFVSGSANCGSSASRQCRSVKANGLDPGPKRSGGTWDEVVTMHAATLWQVRGTKPASPVDWNAGAGIALAGPKGRLKRGGSATGVPGPAARARQRRSSEPSPVRSIIPGGRRVPPARPGCGRWSACRSNSTGRQSSVRGSKVSSSLSSLGVVVRYLACFSCNC